MTARYVHVEVLEIRDRLLQGIEADVRVYYPGGHPFHLIIRAAGAQQPFWRVTDIEPVGSPEVLEAVYPYLSEEELAYRISVALSLANIWDSAKAASDRAWDEE